MKKKIYLYSIERTLFFIHKSEWSFGEDECFVYYIEKYFKRDNQRTKYVCLLHSHYETDMTIIQLCAKIL